MGKLLDSLLSGSTGTIGRLVVANVYGTEILRARPRKKTAAPSAKQLLVQQRMSMTYDFLLPYKEFAKKYFGTRTGMRSPYNQAMTNLLNAFKLDFDLAKVTPTYSEIEFSRGSLLAVVANALTSPVALSIKVDWFENSGGDLLRATDRLQVLFIAEGDARPTFMQNVAARSAGTVDIPLSPNYQGKTLHVWLAFQTEDLNSVSLSAYAGSTIIT